jgi:hypothetical protein
VTQKRYPGTNRDEVQKLFDQERVAMEDQGLVPQSEEWTVENLRFRPDVHHLTVTYGPEEEWSGVRIRPSGTVSVKVNSPAEAKDAIAELKLYKKELAVRKKELSAQASAVRAAHSQKIAGQSSLVRRRGAGGAIVRGVQKSGRERQRQQTQNAVASIANSKGAIDRLVIEIDRLILQLERMAKSG